MALAARSISKKPGPSPGYSFGASRPNARRDGLRFHQTKSVTSRFCACRPKRVPWRGPRFSHTFARSAPRAGPDPPCAGSPENFSMGHHREITHASVDDYEEPVLRSLRQRAGTANESNQCFVVAVSAVWEGTRMLHRWQHVVPADVPCVHIRRSICRIGSGGFLTK